MVDVGVIHGRFQVLHLKHMEYLLAAKMRCRKLYIGISNPDGMYIRENRSDLKRSKKENNPFTYFERFEMIESAMLEFGVKREEFDIVPFPISRPEYLFQYVPADATYYMTICDKWGDEKYELLTGLGLEVEVLWRKMGKEKGITATEIRTLIIQRKPWENYVPKSVCAYIQEHGFLERIRLLAVESQQEVLEIAQQRLDEAKAEGKKNTAAIAIPKES